MQDDMIKTIFGETKEQLNNKEPLVPEDNYITVTRQTTSVKDGQLVTETIKVPQRVRKVHKDTAIDKPVKPIKTNNKTSYEKTDSIKIYSQTANKYLADEYYKRLLEDNKAEDSNGRPVALGSKIDGKYYGIGDCKKEYIEAQYDLKNLLLRDKRLGCKEVSALDFYLDLYRYPDEYSDKDKGALLFCDKEGQVVEDSVKERHLFPFSPDYCNNKYSEEYNNYYTNLDYLVTYCCDWLTPYKDGSVFRSTKSDFIKNIFGVCIDVDSVSWDCLYECLNHGWNEYNRANNVKQLYIKPTYIVNSGSGLHLYYLFEKPVPCFKDNNNFKIIKQLINNLQVIYNSVYTSNKKDESITDWKFRGPWGLCMKPQKKYTINQGFRMVGGLTKTRKRVKVYKYAERYDVADLLRGVGLEDAVDFIRYRHDDRETKTVDNHEKQLLLIDTMVKKMSDNKDDSGVSFNDENDDITNIKVLACSCAKAGIDIDETIDNCYKVATSLGLSVDKKELTDIVKNNYNSVDSHTFIDNSKIKLKKKMTYEKISFKRLKENNEAEVEKLKRNLRLSRNIYKGTYNKVVDNIAVGTRYLVIRDLGMLAFKCGVSYAEYYDDMMILYENIKEDMRYRGAHQVFKQSDFDAAIKGYESAVELYNTKKTVIKQNTIINDLKPVYTPNEKTTHVHRVKVDDKYGLDAITNLIYFYLLDYIDNNKDYMILPSRAQLLNYFVDMYVGDSFDTFGEDAVVSVKINRKTVDKYYSLAVSSVISHKDGFSINKGDTVQYTVQYPFKDITLLENDGITLVKYALGHNCKTIKDIMGLTGLTKPSVIKYKRLIEGD